MVPRRRDVNEIAPKKSSAKHVAEFQSKQTNNVGIDELPLASSNCRCRVTASVFSISLTDGTDFKIE